VVRLLCLKFVSFMEETLGESVIRIVLTVISLLSGMLNSAGQVWTKPRRS
jgi:membrane associated rhomboid family serine protease